MEKTPESAGTPDPVTDSEIDRQIVEAYRRQPQELDPWAEALAKASIAEEPW
jgi:hypothetical protein